jgi:hypothetical protein
MSDSFMKLLVFVEPIMNNNVLGLRGTALKTFSALIKHCRNASCVDSEIKKMRKGLQNISLDYIQGLMKIYIQEESLIQKS